MRRTGITMLMAVVAMITLAIPAATGASSFDWKKYSGTTLNFLADDNPVGVLLKKHAPEFTALTGIRVNVLLFSEQQFRQRLTTILQAKSDQVDVFMSLVSLEGLLYRRAGWYADLTPLVHDASQTAPDYDFSDFGAGVARSSAVNGQLTGIPVNIEGPVLYYRKDVLAKCGLTLPKALSQIETAAAALKKCVPNMVPFATRGLAPALPYTFSNFLHNFGGAYLTGAGRSALATPPTLKAIAYYATLLKEYGPPGVVNYSFPQLTALYGNGQAVMSFESSNEFGKVVATPGRAQDTGVTVLPPGPAGSFPTVIGWELSVSAFSAHKEAAWYFLQWATGRQMEVTLGLEGLAPPRTSPWKAPAFVNWLAAVPVRREWAAALATLSRTGTGQVGPNILLQPQARQIIGNAVDSVILGQATPQTAAAGADQQIDKLIQQSESK
jgi:multiple sugar transport system substrate-binding protein